MRVCEMIIVIVCVHRMMELSTADYRGDITFCITFLSAFVSMACQLFSIFLKFLLNLWLTGADTLWHTDCVRGPIGFWSLSGEVVRCATSMASAISRP